MSLSDHALSRHGTPLARHTPGARPYALPCGCSRKHHCAEALRLVRRCQFLRDHGAGPLSRAMWSGMLAKHRQGV